MKVYTMYRGFQEPRNHRLAGGVEPLGTTALLAPIDGVEDELELADRASSMAFFAAVTTSVAFFTTAALSAAFFTVVASSAAFFTTILSSVAS
jgi:hypothetical protein